MTTNGLILFILYLYTYLSLFMLFAVIVNVYWGYLNYIYCVFIVILFIHILFIFIELDLNSPLFYTCIIIFI